MKPEEIYQNPWTDGDVEAHWDSVASIYLTENRKVEKAHAQRFIKAVSFLDLHPGQRLLNITSRDGGAGPYLKNACNDLSVLHAEISEGLMQVASLLYPGIRQIKIATYSQLPFGDGSFERILSLETIEHVENPVKFLQELYRVGTSDARLVLSCPPAMSEIPYRIYSFLFGGHGEGPHRFPSSRKVKKWLRITGWKLICHEGTLLIPIGPVWLQKAGEMIIRKSQGTFISELGIRQFYVCEKQ